jgi:hypothetical protein
MPDNAESVAMSPLRFLLPAGGMPVLAFGIILSLWGLWNIVRPQSPRRILSPMVLSSIPGIIAIIAIYMACTEFIEMTTSETPPKPWMFAAVAAKAMSFGFFGLLSTIVPILLGGLAFRRHGRLSEYDSSS